MEGNEGTSSFTRDDLSDVWRDGGGECSDTQSGDKAAECELHPAPMARGLDDDAHSVDQGIYPDRSATAQPARQVRCAKGAEDAPDREEADEQALEIRFPGWHADALTGAVGGPVAVFAVGGEAQERIVVHEDAGWVALAGVPA